MTEVSANEELRDAIGRGASTIKIAGRWAGKVIGMKATGPVAWAIVIGTIGVAVVATVLTAASGGASVPGTAPMMGVSAIGGITSLGAEASAATIALAVAGGGVGVLTSLYSGYRIAEKGENRVVLVKK
nr:hypothetical protein [uncultured Rhodopila sp.]